MVRAKKYETVSTFVKVMQKKLWSLFSGHGVCSTVPCKICTIFTVAYTVLSVPHQI